MKIANVVLDTLVGMLALTIFAIVLVLAITNQHPRITCPPAATQHGVVDSRGFSVGPTGPACK